MSAKSMSAAIAAILAVSMPVAFAAQPAPAPASNGPAAAPAMQPTAPAGRTAGAEPGKTVSTEPGKTAAAEPTHMKPGEIRFSEMNGATVYGPNKKDIGKVDEVVLDRDGKIAAVVIKNGGFLGLGGKDVAVAMNQIQVSTDKDGKPVFTLNMTEDQLKSAQNYDLNPPKENRATGSSTPPAGTTHR